MTPDEFLKHLQSASYLMYWTAPTPSCCAGVKWLRNRKGESKVVPSRLTAAMKVPALMVSPALSTAACKNHTPSHAERANSDALGLVTLTLALFMIVRQRLYAGSLSWVQDEKDEPTHAWIANQLTPS